MAEKPLWQNSGAKKPMTWAERDSGSQGEVSEKESLISLSDVAAYDFFATYSAASRSHSPTSPQLLQASKSTEDLGYISRQVSSLSEKSDIRSAINVNVDAPSDVYKQRSFTYTGKEDHLFWKECGINLHFPSSDLLAEIEGTVSVVSASDEHIFPEGSEAVSAVYDISATQPFPDKITVELEHCVYLRTDNEASSIQMSFAIADTQDGAPYLFHELTGGKFGVGHYGRIQLNRFSRLVILIKWHFGLSIPFFAGVYYRPNNRAVFVVAKNLQAHTSAIENEYRSNENIDPEKFSLMCNHTCSSIKLEIPPPTGECNWNVIPLVEPPQIEMAEIREYQPGRHIPQIGLKLEWEGKGIVKDGRVKVKVIGTLIEKSIHMLCSTTSAAASSLQPTQPRRLLTLSLQSIQHLTESASQSPSQVQYPVSQDDRLDMVSLKKFPTPTGVINIMQKVSPHYKDVGTLLLDDRDGSKLKAIEDSCNYEVNAITHNMD